MIEDYKKSLPHIDNLLDVNIRYLRCFCTLSEALRIELLDCYIPPKDVYQQPDILMANAKVFPLVLQMPWCSGFDKDTLERALMVRIINGHGSNHNVFSGAVVYRYISKMRHSCDATSTLYDRNLYAIKDIKQGEDITCCYVWPHHTTPCRKLLLKNCSFFECECQRCTKGIDKFRGYNCMACNRGTIWHDNEKDVWTCETCKKRIWISVVHRELQDKSDARTMFNVPIEQIRD